MELFTNGWSIHETCHRVISFMKTKNNINVKCDVIETKATKYKCFKVSINILYDVDFFNPSFWPIGVAVGIFFNRTKKTDEVQ